MIINLNNKKIEISENKSIMQNLIDKGKHISGVCKMNLLDPYGSCRLCLVNVNNRILPACSTFPKENDVIDSSSQVIIDIRKSALELMLSDHYGDCIGPCNNGCPTKSQVQNYLALVANGKYHEAVSLMKKDYILPAVLGRVCPAFCERECRRNLVEEPLAIRQLKRFAADYDLAHGPWMPEIPKSTGKHVAIIGGGPAGLSCAYYLRLKGHEVTIYEAMPELGGMLRYGIPEFRLPKNILSRDIDTVINTGIHVKTNAKIGEDISFDEIKNKHDAVFIGIGAWKSFQLKIEGCDMLGSMEAIDFLRKISLGEEVDIGQNVMVIGGGSSAMDVARTAKRLGADVTITYRRTKNEMPAEKLEIEEAEEEGIHFNILARPVKIIGENNIISQIELIKMELGEPDESGRCRPIECEGSNYCSPIDTVIFAIGQMSDTNFLDNIGINHQLGLITYDKLTYETNIEGVFTGGDVATGTATIIEAIAGGKEAAYMINFYLDGKLAHYKKALENPWENLDEIDKNEDLKYLILNYRPYNHWKKVTTEDYKDRERIKRIKAKVLSPEIRKANFDEIESTITEDQAISELKRCMACGCLDAFECKLREYSKLYGCEQDYYLGEMHKDPIDESHPYVMLDNNKCILCGRCVNLTHEITGEGLIDNLNRGFPTKNAPPIGLNLGDVQGDFIGCFVDFCPTGAFTIKTPFEKHGPWEIIQKSTICQDCGLGCEMYVDTYKGFAVNISSKGDSWNLGLICDRPRFNRLWEKEIKHPMIKSNKNFIEISHDEAKKIINQQKKNIAIILSSEVTNDEAHALKEFSEKHGFKIAAIYDKGISNAKLTDIFSSKKIKIDASTNDYPLLKPFIHIAKKQGIEFVKTDYDLAILNAPAEIESVPTLILHKGINEVGLMQMGFDNEIPKADVFILIGSIKQKFKGFTISMGYNSNADLILPFPSWISRSGQVINSEGRKLEVKKIFDGPKLTDILSKYF